MPIQSALKVQDGLEQADQNVPGQAAQPVQEPPEKPLVTIEAGHGFGIDLRGLWAYRDLFYFLVWRDVKVRYKQTAIGVAWAVLQPVLTMVVFTVLFGRLAHVPSEGQPYPIFVFAGLLPWSFFNTAVASSGNSLVGSSPLITKVYFPRMLIPLAAVGAALVDFTIASMVLGCMMIYYGVGVGSGLLMLPFLMVVVALFASGVGMWMAALNVKYRDVRYALPFLISIWMYVTPVIYPTSFIPARWRWVLMLNPLSGLIEGFRCAIFDTGFQWSALAISGALTLIVLVYVGYSFKRMEREFADVI